MALDNGYLGYDGLQYDRAELMSAMRQTYSELIDFVSTPAFIKLMETMGALHHSERPRFVVDVLLKDEVLASHGIFRPNDILIQRSAFGDRRPTLFVVKKYLPDRYRDVWQNVNITFDNEFSSDSIGRDPQTSWRPPLPVEVQASAMAADIPLENL